MDSFLTIAAAILFAFAANGFIWLIVCTFAPARLFRQFKRWTRKSLIVLCASILVVCGLASLVMNVVLTERAAQFNAEVTSAAKSQGLHVTDIDWRGVTVFVGDCEIYTQYDKGVFTLSYQPENVVVTPALMSQLCSN